MQNQPVSYVIIGNGIAGVTAAEILHNEDSSADITVIADDPFPVYYRPALKDYLAGRVREDKLWARPNSFYQDHNIRFLSERVIGIQAGQHTVQIKNGRQVGYNKLLLASGARASTLKCPGIDLAGVTTLRTVADYQAVQNRLSTARHIVVSGSGTLALETIETLRHRGYSVTHLLRRRTLWSEVLDATASDLVLLQERRDGVDVHLEEEIAEVTGKNGQVTGVVTTTGARISCDMVIIAIGVEPIVDFIKSSGIPCSRGVKVDAGMRTSVPDIYAAGDVLETTDTTTGRVRIIGQWYPAIQQARAAAYSMLDLLNTSRPFRSSTFYNATFLYGLDFASAGLTQMPVGAERIETRSAERPSPIDRSSKYQEFIADPQPRIYRKVLLKDGVAVGMLFLGDRSGGLAFKRSIDAGVNLLPVASKLFASDFKLDAWLDSQGVPPPILNVSREGAVAVKQVTYAGGTAFGVTISKPQPVMEALLVPVAPSGGQGPHLPAPSLKETILSQTKVMTIGRQAGTYLLIDHPSVSRRHAEIAYANGQYVLRDLGSANGTFVNDTRLEANSAHILKSGDQICFGKVLFAFRVQSVDGQAGTIGTGSKSMPGMTKLHSMATGFYDPLAAGQPQPPSGQPILIENGSLMLPEATSPVPASVVATLQEIAALIVIVQGKPEVFPLKQGKRLTIGRGKGNDIVLPEVAASRKHAEVFPGPGGFYLRDLGSSNGVIVNSTRIDNPYLLVHGDRFTIGSISTYFLDAGASSMVGDNAPARSSSSDSPKPADISPGNIPCPNCGTSNVPVARFCAKCGTPLDRVSPARA